MNLYNVDVVYETETAEKDVFDSFRKHQLTVYKYDKSGPGGGNPNFHLMGTRENMQAWISENYGEGTAIDYEMRPIEYTGA